MPNGDLKGATRYFSILPESAGFPKGSWTENGCLYLDCEDGIYEIDFNERPERVFRLAEKTTLRRLSA